jgi:hypothetical protein
MKRRRQSGTNDSSISNIDLSAQTALFLIVTEYSVASPAIAGEFDLHFPKRYYFFIFWIAMRCRECATHAGKMHCGSRYNAVRSRTNPNFNLTIASGIVIGRTAAQGD